MGKKATKRKKRTAKKWEVYTIIPDTKWVKSRIIDGQKFVLNGVLTTRSAADSSARSIRSHGKYLARVIPSKTRGYAVYIRERIPL